METLAYYKKLASRYQKVASTKEIITKVIQIGEFNIRLKFANESLIPFFYRAFSHLSLEETGHTQVSLVIYFWEEQKSDTFPNVPWHPNNRHHLGYIESYSDVRFHTLHQPGSEAIYMLDTHNNEGYYWVNSISDIPHWESDFPLRMIFHWWLKDSYYQPVHSAAIGTEKGGVLLVGKGGSGKSTSTLSCVNSELKIAGDDYVLLDCKRKEVYSLFSLTKANSKSLKLLPNLNLDIKNLAEPIDDKYRIMLYPDYQKSLIQKMPVLAILLPVVTNNDKTTIIPCNTAEAMLALAPTTLFQLPGLREEAFKKMSDFVQSSKSFKLLLGKDHNNLPHTLHQFIQSLY